MAGSVVAGMAAPGDDSALAVGSIALAAACNSAAAGYSCILALPTR